MALPTHYTGKDGEIKINGVATTLVDFDLSVDVGVITSSRIGKVSDTRYPGKKHVSGKIKQVLVTGDLFAMMIGATADITTSTLETLLAATELLTSQGRHEIDAITDPTTPTSVKVTLTVGTVATTAGSIVIHGTDASGDYITEVLDFDAMAVGDGAQVVYGSQAFTTSDFVDVEAALAKGSSGTCSELKVEGVTGTKTITPGTSEKFTIIGKVVDAAGKHFQMTASNCFFVGGSFPIGDAEALVETDLPFEIEDADTDLELVWTSA